VTLLLAAFFLGFFDASHIEEGGPLRFLSGHTLTTYSAALQSR